MRDVCADFGAELGEFNGDTNHVHLLVNFPPAVAISRLVNSLKGVSSRRLRQESRTRPATTGGRNGCGLGPTSPDRSAAPRSTSCAQYIEQQNQPS